MPNDRYEFGHDHAIEMVMTKLRQHAADLTAHGLDKLRIQLTELEEHVHRLHHHVDHLHEHVQELDAAVKACEELLAKFQDVLDNHEYRLDENEREHVTFRAAIADINTNLTRLYTELGVLRTQVNKNTADIADLALDLNNTKANVVINANHISNLYDVKQDKIEDLDEIRKNANFGAWAKDQIPGINQSLTYATGIAESANAKINIAEPKIEQNIEDIAALKLRVTGVEANIDAHTSDINRLYAEKQDKIDDLDSIRSEANRVPDLVDRVIVAEDKINTNENDIILLKDNKQDKIDENSIYNWNVAATWKHLHDNKEILDGITAEDIENWNSAETDPTAGTVKISTNELDNLSAQDVVDILATRKTILLTNIRDVPSANYDHQFTALTLSRYYIIDDESKIGLWLNHKYNFIFEATYADISTKRPRGIYWYIWADNAEDALGDISRYEAVTFGFAPEDAEANKLEAVRMNGEILPITNKTVDIGAVISDADYKHITVTENSISDGVNTVYGLSDTEKATLHTHDNKDILDTITADSFLSEADREKIDNIKDITLTIGEGEDLYKRTVSDGDTTLDMIAYDALEPIGEAVEVAQEAAEDAAESAATAVEAIAPVKAKVDKMTTSTLELTDADGNVHEITFYTPVAE